MVTLGELVIDMEQANQTLRETAPALERITGQQFTELPQIVEEWESDRGRRSVGYGALGKYISPIEANIWNAQDISDRICLADGRDLRRVITHELVHALQYQNNSRIRSLYLCTHLFWRVFSDLYDSDFYEALGYGEVNSNNVQTLRHHVKVLRVKQDIAKEMLAINIEGFAEYISKLFNPLLEVSNTRVYKDGYLAFETIERAFGKNVAIATGFNLMGPFDIRDTYLLACKKLGNKPSKEILGTFGFVRPMNVDRINELNLNVKDVVNDVLAQFSDSSCVYVTLNNGVLERVT